LPDIFRKDHAHVLDENPFLIVPDQDITKLRWLIKEMEIESMIIINDSIINAKTKKKSGSCLLTDQETNLIIWPQKNPSQAIPNIRVLGLADQKP
jgi:hypothetical protein